MGILLFMCDELNEVRGILTIEQLRNSFLNRGYGFRCGRDRNDMTIRWVNNFLFDDTHRPYPYYTTRPVHHSFVSRNNSFPRALDFYLAIEQRNLYN